jgi:hypothetical protein
MRFRAGIIALLVLPSPYAPAQIESSRFGLVAGRTYSYVGIAQWTDTAERARTAPLRWRMDIVQARSWHDVRGAVVRGWIQELAWYTPGQRPDFSVLFEYRGRLYHIAAQDSVAAIDSLAAAIRDGVSAARRGELIVDSSLVVGETFGSDVDRGRTDGFYAWDVDSQAAAPRRLRWSPLAIEPTRWRIVYRTLADEQVIDFVPGVGVSRFTYVHHGTVAAVDVHLSTVTTVRSAHR